MARPRASRTADRSTSCRPPAAPAPSPDPEAGDLELEPPRDRIVQRGRAKAYRPLPAGRRRELLADGLAAYGRGDVFLAHEILEPAWMGASDPAERDLYQGLIKLAAAFVHDARGNPAGARKNLVGARDRLADAIEAGTALGIDVESLLRSIDAALEASAGERPGRIGPIVPVPRTGSRS